MPSALSLAGKKVVIEEANCIIALLLERALTAAGCKLYFAFADGRETAEIVQTENADMVLLDTDARHNAALDPPTRGADDCSLVIVTSESPLIANELARSLGASGYLCKPFSFDGLVQTLERALVATHAPPAMAETCLSV